MVNVGIPVLNHSSFELQEQEHRFMSTTRTAFTEDIIDGSPLATHRIDFLTAGEHAKRVINSNISSCIEMSEL
jgi:hypothetical protein